MKLQTCKGLLSQNPASKHVHLFKEVSHAHCKVEGSVNYVNYVKLYGYISSISLVAICHLWLMIIKGKILHASTELYLRAVECIVTNTYLMNKM